MVHGKRAGASASSRERRPAAAGFPRHGKESRAGAKAQAAGARVSRSAPAYTQPGRLQRVPKCLAPAPWCSARRWATTTRSSLAWSGCLPSPTATPTGTSPRARAPAGTRRPRTHSARCGGRWGAAARSRQAACACTGAQLRPSCLLPSHARRLRFALPAARRWRANARGQARVYVPPRAPRRSRRVGMAWRARGSGVAGASSRARAAAAAHRAGFQQRHPRRRLPAQRARRHPHRRHRLLAALGRELGPVDRLRHSGWIPHAPTGRVHLLG